MSSIRVRGFGDVSTPVDHIVINFSIQSEDYDYQEVLRKLNIKSNALRYSLPLASFDEKDLKTINFRVEPKYQYQDGRNIFTGYRGYHDLVLEFDYDKTRLNRLFLTLQDNKSEALFTLNFIKKDNQMVKDEAIKLAVSNAFHNASIIALSAGIKVGKVINIIYDVQQASPYQGLRIEAMSYAPRDSLDIIPSDIKVSASVIIEYEIIN